MTSIEQQIVDIIQDGFPIAERPYAVLADLLNRTPTCHPEGTQDRYSEQSVFDAVESLRASGVIRRIGGVYDSRKLGFVSRLVAGKVPASELDFSEPRDGRAPTAMETFAAAVNGIPAITHNYVRSHEYNVWFTVIAESEEAVQAVLNRLESTTALHDAHAMAAKRMFKINTVMKSAAPSADNGKRGVEGKHGVDSAAGLNLSKGCLASRASLPVSDSDKLRIRLLCGDIPHSLTPFTDLCEQCGCSLRELLEGARSDLAEKRMRRFGAVLRHQEAGFAHNAMVCFKIDERRFLDERRETRDERQFLDERRETRDERQKARGERETANGGESRIAEAGKILAANSHVSHCYERAPFEGFPYNVYAMFHAAGAEELDLAIAEAAQSITAAQSIIAAQSITAAQSIIAAQFVTAAQSIEQSINAPVAVEYAVLRSLRELKKTSFTFFAADKI